MNSEGWTDERRAKQSAAIQTWRPWEHSTGPRTAAGKAYVSQNAYKGAQRRWFRAYDVVMTVFRRHPGKKSLNDCGPLSPRQIEAAQTLVTEGPGRPIEHKSRDYSARSR